MLSESFVREVSGTPLFLITCAGRRQSDQRLSFLISTPGGSFMGANEETLCLTLGDTPTLTPAHQPAPESLIDFLIFISQHVELVCLVLQTPFVALLECLAKSVAR